MLRRMIQAACAAVFLCAGAANAAPPPFEAYGRLPSLDMMNLSPNGTRVAYVRAGDVKRWIVVQKLGVPTPLATMDIGDQKLRMVRWADSDHLIVVTSSLSKIKGLLWSSRQELNVVQVLDLAKGTQYNLLELGVKGSRYNMLNVAAGMPTFRTIGGHTMVFTPAYYIPVANRPDFKTGLFRIDLTENDIKLVSRPTDVADNQDWVIDENGNVLAVEQYFESTTTWRLSLYRDGGRDITMDQKAPIEQPSVLGLSEDGSGIILQLPDDMGERPLYEKVSLADGARTPWRRDTMLMSVEFDRNTGRAVGGDQSIDKTDYAWFDPIRANVWKVANATFKKAVDLDIVSWSDDKNQVIVKVFGPEYGNGYFYLDMKTHSAAAIGPEYDQISQVFEEKWIEYKAADGRVIHAYLTLPQLPPGKQAKDLPLIVFPHGGPHARDYPGFDFFSQGLASLGYAVLQPEFRGSAGFGKDLLWAGFGEMGKKMQTDLSDGVRALAAQGLIDPKRVCIGGWSYGGYAAMAGATFDPGVYRCAMAGAGVSDTRKQVRHWQTGKWENQGVRFWKRFLGVDDLSDSKIDATNPKNFADRVTIPMLLIHGRDDTTVPFEQSVMMASALDSAGKKYEFVKLEGEDHHLSRSKSRLAAMIAMRDFLLKYNPPN